MACDTSSFIENLNNKKSFENRSPELVEKKDPREKPILEIELQSAKNNKEKLLLELKKIKKIITKKTK